MSFLKINVDSEESGGYTFSLKNYILSFRVNIDFQPTKYERYNHLCVV